MEKIRQLGRKIYFEDLLEKCRTEIFLARGQLKEAEEKGEGVKARATVEDKMNRFSYLKSILNDEIQEENPDWAMYEMIGHKEKEESDKFFDEWMKRNPMWINKS
jgi:hypothetical protein